MKALSNKYTIRGNGMDDLEIIELYFARDEMAIKETAVKYGKLCYSMAYNILNSKEDAEECVNDTYLGVWNAIPPLRPDNFMAFISRIARNQSLKRFEYLKREKRSYGIVVSLSELDEVVGDDNINTNISAEEIGVLISRFLREQKEDVRNVFIRKYYFFDSVRDIAKRYSFTESKVKNMLYHTRNKLKDYLIKEGIVL